MHKFICTVVLSLITSHLFAQQIPHTSSVEIYNKIQKLNFLGSVLYVAAHPDDENTRMIAHLANERHARTGYLSLTRGDGGQNLIGSQLGDLLGVIRTQELLEARKIDGGQQFFTRANDFGYSKNPDETLNIWNKNQVLSDVVYVIRKFRPDVIINRFDARTPGTTHGHHTSSAILSKEAFDLTNNAAAYSDQLSHVATWQPKRLFFNTSFWFYGGREKFNKADKSKLHKIETGTFYPLIGQSNQEIAALSRSRHQSQGFGTSGARGEDLDYLEFIKGTALKNDDDIFEGIDTTWNRIEGGKDIGIILNLVEKNFNFKDASASVPALLSAYKLIQNLKDSHWKEIKSDEIKIIIASCMGIFIEAVASNQTATPGEKINVTLEAINRSAVPATLRSVSVPLTNKIAPQNLSLKSNIANEIKLEIDLPADLEYTEPYWLKDQPTIGMYTVTNQDLIGTPDINRQLKVSFLIDFGTVTIPFERQIIYKFNDKVLGEVYKPFDIIPDVTLRIVDDVQIFPNGDAKKIQVSVQALTNDVTGFVQINLPNDWKVSPQKSVFSNLAKNENSYHEFSITPPKDAQEIEARIVANINGKIFNQQQIVIEYPHITKQQVLKTAEAKLIKLDIKTGNERIGYIMGAGDVVNQSLMQMGYNVKLLEPSQITSEKLTEFDVIITGVRAYNVLKEMINKQQLLFDFVEKGNTMIVQYNTMGDTVLKNIAPYSLEISRDRVTEEDAAVTFLAPKHKILNFPNKITSADFTNWKQEQGLYYPDTWDKAFIPIISSHDQDEDPKHGALLVAKYGKGHYIYTGLSFFRELPQGVSGAFRLMANMISISN